ncbi:MAG TPA: hypothetical protein ENK02_10575, partial [Planctomycetes bacterium]|nr:hypothetical protein [Planctomycetota bacterium]
MKLRRLWIGDFPGFHRVLELEMKGDLVLIQGPNESGKSSLCRAMKTLLWPGGAGGRVEAVFERGDGGLLEARLDGGVVRWRSQGR